jgi:hypothetical protein
MPTRHKVSTPSAVDDEDGLGKFRSYLKGHGIGDADIEKAVEHFKRDAEARDRMPANGLPSHGGMGGHLSGASKDTDFDFGETEPDVDYGGQRPSELRGPYGAPTGTSQHFSETRKLGELAAARLEGGGVSRRLSNDSALTSDESFEADYPPREKER